MPVVFVFGKFACYPSVRPFSKRGVLLSISDSKSLKTRWEAFVTWTAHGRPYSVLEEQVGLPRCNHCLIRTGLVCHCERL